MTLPTFAAERRRLQQAPAAIDQYLLQTPALSSKPAGCRCCFRSMGQTDGQTDGRPTVSSASVYSYDLMALYKSVYYYYYIIIITQPSVL